MSAAQADTVGRAKATCPAVAKLARLELGSVFAASSASSAGVCASYPDDINNTGILLVTGAITLSPPNLSIKAAATSKATTFSTITLAAETAHTSLRS